MKEPLFFLGWPWHSERDIWQLVIYYSTYNCSYNIFELLCKSPSQTLFSCLFRQLLTLRPLWNIREIIIFTEKLSHPALWMVSLLRGSDRRTSSTCCTHAGYRNRYHQTCHTCSWYNRNNKNIQLVLSGTSISLEEKKKEA